MRKCTHRKYAVSTPGVRLTADAYLNASETGADVAEDVAALRSGAHTRATLLDYCLSGADEDRVQGWHDYVSAVAEAAGVRDSEAGS